MGKKDLSRGLVNAELGGAVATRRVLLSWGQVGLDPSKTLPGLLELDSPFALSCRSGDLVVRLGLARLFMVRRQLVAC